MPQRVRRRHSVRLVQAVVRRVVEPPQTERGTACVAFARVIQHDVEQHLDARSVERGHAMREFGNAARRQPHVGNHQRNRVVAPVVGEAERPQMPVVDRGGHGHQLGGRDTQPDEVRERGRMSQARAGPAQWRRNSGMQLGESAHMQFVHEGARPWCTRAARGRDDGVRLHDRLRHERRAVVVVARGGIRRLSE